jgi:hypothetical protein
VVLVANYGSERPPLSDKRSYGCTTGKRGLCLVYNAAMKRELRPSDTEGPSAASVHVAQRRPTCFSGVCGRRTRSIVRALTASLSEEGRFALTEVTHIMVDEAQDMKPLFYRLICRLVSMARSPPTLMLVGDPPTGGQSLERCGLRFNPRPSTLVRAAGRVWRVHALTVSSDAPRWSRPTTPCRAVGDLQPGRVGTRHASSAATCGAGPHAGLQQVLDWLCPKGLRAGRARARAVPQA